MPNFQFTEPFGDARVEELKLLSWANQHGELTFRSVPTGAWFDLLVSLVSSGLFTVFSYEWAKKRYTTASNPDPDLANSAGLPGESELERSLTYARIRAVYDLYAGRPPAGLRLTHPGRVRISVLKQALRAGHEREPFGILLDGRHWERDLQIAILDASDQSPLALAFLDMNGLKQVNDSRGHDAGDLALKTYFQAVASALGDQGQAYRVGGDEVLLILPRYDVQAAVQLLRRACTKLMSERLEPAGASTLLSIAAGVITSTNPSDSPIELRSASDKVQYRAKEESRKATPRPSVIAINGQDEMVIIPHDSRGVTQSRLARSWWRRLVARFTGRF